MKHFQIEIAISQVYEVEVLADDLTQAQDIAEQINPTETTESVRFVEVRRDITDTTEQPLEELLENLTGLVFTVSPTGGNCYALEAETEYGTVRIATAEAQLPTEPDELVTVTYSSNYADTVLMTFKASNLLDLRTMAAVVDAINKHENNNKECPKCGGTQSECREASEGTVAMIRRVRDVMKHLDTQTRQDLSDLLDGYTVHALPTCNKGSEA